MSEPQLLSFKKNCREGYKNCGAICIKKGERCKIPKEYEPGPLKCEKGFACGNACLNRHWIKNCNYRPGKAYDTGEKVEGLGEDSYINRKYKNSGERVNQWAAWLNQQEYGFGLDEQQRSVPLPPKYAAARTVYQVDEQGVYRFFYCDSQGNCVPMADPMAAASNPMAAASNPMAAASNPMATASDPMATDDDPLDDVNIAPAEYNSAVQQSLADTFNI